MPEKFEIVTLAEAQAGLPAFLNLELIRADERVTDLAKQLGEVKVKVDAITVTDAATYKTANDALAGLKKLLKAGEEHRKAITGPHDKYCKAANKFFKELMADAVAAEEGLERRMLTHYNDAERKRKEEERRLAEQAAAARRQEEARAAATGQAALPIIEPAPAQPPESPKTIRSDKATGSVRSKWKGQVVDADLVPLAFLSPDMTKIQRAVDLGVRDIPGVYIHEERTIASRVAA